jgi:hypothetical protein
MQKLNLAITAVYRFNLVQPALSTDVNQQFPKSRVRSASYTHIFGKATELLGFLSAESFSNCSIANDAVNPAAEQSMDFFNNAKGRYVGTNSNTHSDAKYTCKQYTDNLTLQVAP